MPLDSAPDHLLKRAVLGPPAAVLLDVPQQLSAVLKHFNLREVAWAQKQATAINHCFWKPVPAICQVALA